MKISRSLACSILLCAAAPSQAATYFFSQGGFFGGGSVSGSFTAFDDDRNGQIATTLGDRLTAFTLTYSGGADAAPFTLGLKDVTAFAFDLDRALGDSRLYQLGRTDRQGRTYEREGIAAASTNVDYRLGGLAFGDCDGGAPCTLFFDFATPAIEVGTQPLSITAVPEPATWALMIGGVGLVGGALRRRNRARFALA